MVIQTPTKPKNGRKPELADGIKARADLVIKALDFESAADEIVFDPSRMSVYDLEDIATAERTMQYRTIAGILMRSVVSLPSSWGDPQDVATYNRPLPEWRAMIKAYIKAAGDTGE